MPRQYSFKVKSEYKYKPKATYSSIAAEGSAYIRNLLKGFVKVATVSYSTGHAHGNPVLFYLSRHREVQGDVKKLDGNGYTLTSSAVPPSFIAPTTNEPYFTISGDFNPIHINPYFFDYAVLPCAITHGMWSSAATRKYVENVVAQGRPERVLQYDVSFVGMVLPGDEHYGMRDGNLAVKVETSNQRDERVLNGTAEVAQVPTIYVFTGQGSQKPGMGMELYNSSPARAVWEAVHAHLLAVYGISIVDTVKNNPKEETIHFGGRQRQDSPPLRRYRCSCSQYTFSHPNGLLFATQIAQIALVVTEKASFESMKSKGLVQNDCAFACHSLGECSVLASIADVLAISALVDFVSYRGITMQRAVKRDEHNRPNYAMCTVSPSRIGKSFNDATLREIVDSVSHQTNLLPEIVNYNVEGQQYVCAGELLALETLTNVLNYLKIEKTDIQQSRKCRASSSQAASKRGRRSRRQKAIPKLERGFTIVSLPGIDVLFHSRYLWPGVMPFRAYLSKKINPLHLNPDILVGKCIPSKLARSAAQLGPRQLGLRRTTTKLAYTILAELPAYQFASPVRWIQTQDLLLTHYNFERLVELDPGPIPTGMATRTLKAKYEAGDGAISRDEIVDAPSQTVVETPTPVAVAAGGAATAIPDEPLKAVDTLRLIISQKLKKEVGEVSISKVIKDLVGGKSTLQNEILGDLQLEFLSAPEKSEELPLDELGATPSVGHTGPLDKHANGLAPHMTGQNMPGGFNITTAKTHLNKTWGLGPAPHCGFGS
ncbi:unnamed protein product [Rhizoctonia solani]|uniref:Malonyl-CoA:ACP transacylase (MAT) domain-containing protein n=1 Tax=Rhizoctonia solani TaxID=456999 RepID=A0A8H3DX08_9AGAM|nr:unnamed protein product [Rhizoctonia solani]